VRWNLRMVAATRDIWKASELRVMLAEAGLVISQGKMHNLWAGQPNSFRAEDLDVICHVLSCTPNDLLTPGPIPTAARPGQQPAAASGAGQIVPSRTPRGRSRPPA
jgi:putative transcriptional regulator